MPAYAVSTEKPAASSAISTAFLMASTAESKSLMALLRQPRDSATPMPASSSLPFSVGRHTTAHVLLSPRSRPATKGILRAINLKARLRTAQRAGLRPRPSEAWRHNLHGGVHLEMYSLQRLPTALFRRSQSLRGVKSVSRSARSFCRRHRSGGGCIGRIRTHGRLRAYHGLAAVS